MLIIKLAVRNLTRHTRRTLLLGFLITIGIAVLFTASAVFEGTNAGLQKTLVRSLTGDVVLADSDGGVVSLFGNELPIVSEYESILPIASYSEIVSSIEGLSGMEAHTSIVSAAAQVDVGGFQKNVPVFGIDPSTYFSVCTDLEIEYGDIDSLNQKGVLLNSVIAAEIETSLGRKLKIGDPIQFKMYDGNSFNLRTAPLSGVYRYTASNEALDRVVLADLTTVRSLASYTLGFKEVGSSSDPEDSEDLFDMDALFNDAEDVKGNSEVEFDLAGLELQLADTSERDVMVLTDNGAWNFILLKAEDGKTSEMIKALSENLNTAAFNVRILSWRRAAGNTALAIFAVQTIFNIGIGFLAFGAILVIMNSLVISVFERTSEIGTMRSLGAHSGFIRKLFITESMILTMTAALLGIVIGIIVVILIGKSGYRIENQLLISLFGGNMIQTKISLRGIFTHFSIAILVGALAWIYPVNLAMKVQPLSAMNSE
ncbi:MAG: FtsX-like permease family protein [Spirochaetales bacterium]|nr:FtsX-like permease family protein [Spirochaetales bacterium]